MPCMPPSSEATVTTVTPVGNEPIAWRKALTSTVEAGAEAPGLIVHGSQFLPGRHVHEEGGRCGLIQP